MDMRYCWWDHTGESRRYNAYALEIREELVRLAYLMAHLLAERVGGWDFQLRFWSSLRIFDRAKSLCKARRALNTETDWRGAETLSGWRRHKYCMGQAWRGRLMKRMGTGSPACFAPHPLPHALSQPPVTLFLPPTPPTRTRCSRTSSLLVLSFPWQLLAVLCCHLTPSPLCCYCPILHRSSLLPHTPTPLSPMFLSLGCMPMFLFLHPCHQWPTLHTLPFFFLLWCVFPSSHHPARLVASVALSDQSLPSLLYVIQLQTVSVKTEPKSSGSYLSQTHCTS